MNNPICTFYIDSKKFKTIVCLEDAYYASDDGIGNSTVKIQLSGSSPDPQLRNLSSIPYMVITNDCIFIDDKTYKAISSTIPKQIQYKVIPIVNNFDIIDYKIEEKVYDNLFIIQNYVRELKEAEMIIIPVSPLNIDMFSLGDLLAKSYVESKGQLIFTSYSGVTITVKDEYIEEKAKRYIFVNGMDIKGTSIDLPLTYTKQSLIQKYEILQERLNEYGKIRIETISTTLRSIPDLLKNVPNKYIASSIYEDVSKLVEKIKNMN